GRSDRFVDQAVPELALPRAFEFSKLGRGCLKQFQSRHFHIANPKTAWARMVLQERRKLRLSHDVLLRGDEFARYMIEDSMLGFNVIDADRFATPASARHDGTEGVAVCWIATATRRRAAAVCCFLKALFHHPESAAGRRVESVRAAERGSNVRVDRPRSSTHLLQKISSVVVRPGHSSAVR